MFQSPSEKISAYLSENGIKQSFLAKKTGIKPQSLSAKLKGTTKLSYDEIAVICGVLGLQPNDVIETRLPENIGA